MSEVSPQEEAAASLPKPRTPWMDPAYRPEARDNRINPRMQDVLREMETAGPLTLTKPAPGMQVTKAAVASLNETRKREGLPPLASHTQGDGGCLRNDEGQRVTNEGFAQAAAVHEARLQQEGGGEYLGPKMEPRVAQALRDWHLLPEETDIGLFLEDGGRELLTYLHSAMVQQALDDGRIRNPKEASAILPGAEWVGYPLLMLKKGPHAMGAVTQATLNPSTGVSSADQFREAIAIERKAGRTPLYMAISTPGNPGLSLSHEQQCALANLAAEERLYLILDTFYEHCIGDEPTSNLALMQAELSPEAMARVIRIDGTTKWLDSEDKTAWAVATGGEGAKMLKDLRADQLSRAAASSPHRLAKLFAAVDMRKQGFQHVGEMRAVLGARMRQMTKTLEKIATELGQKGVPLGWMSSGRSYYATVEVPASRGAGNGADPTVNDVFTKTGMGFAGMQDFGQHPDWKHFGRFSAANSRPTVEALRNLREI